MKMGFIQVITLGLLFSTQLSNCQRPVVTRDIASLLRSTLTANSNAGQMLKMSMRGQKRGPTEIAGIPTLGQMSQVAQPQVPVMNIRQMNMPAVLTPELRTVPEMPVRVQSKMPELPISVKAKEMLVTRNGPQLLNTQTVGQEFQRVTANERNQKEVLNEMRIPNPSPYLPLSSPMSALSPNTNLPPTALSKSRFLRKLPIAPPTI